MISPVHTVERNPFRTTLKSWGNRCSLVFTGGIESETRVSERWCEMDFVHPQYHQGLATLDKPKGHLVVAYYLLNWELESGLMLTLD